MQSTGTLGSDAPEGERREGLSPEAVGHTACAARGRWLAGALITLLPAVMFINVWRMGGAAAGLDDLIYYLPVRAYIGETLRAGHLPMWNPYVALGSPLAADPQAGLWYPFTWLFVILPPLVAYSLNIWIHYVLAGWGMYRFLRALGRTWQPALLGAIAFEFCPYLISHREHLTILQAVAWVPWIFYAWQRYATESQKPEAEHQEPRPESRKPNTERRDRCQSSFGATIAAAFWGLQLLVQHIQPSIVTAVMVGAYVLFVLRPLRRRIVWTWLLVTASGGVLAAVQWLPTWYLFSGSGRGSAAYYVFTENSWVLSSTLMFLYPMLFGNSTPNLWGEGWWGISHLSEQWCYATLVMLVLSMASLGLMRRRNLPGQRKETSLHRRDAGATTDRGDHDAIPAAAAWNREILFWWAACLVALLIALGDATPLSKLLFHVPVYRNLRVPARWILVWSFALPVLASFVMNAVVRGGAAGERARWWVVFSATRALPVLAAGTLLFMWSGPWVAQFWGHQFRSEHARPLLEGLGSAIHRFNPAIIVPLIVAAVTIGMLLHWVRRPSAVRAGCVMAALIADLACVAPFVAVDTSGYPAEEILAQPPLSQAIKMATPDEGHRLLVPRFGASYHRPLEVLWPQSNVLHDVPTLNGYGPLGDAGSRLLLAFMPWGSSEEILSLLRNPALLEWLGVRFIAVRSEEERELLATAMVPGFAEPQWQELAGAERMEPVGWESGVLWAVRIDAPGIYELELDAAPVAGSTSRWFVRLETTDHQQIGKTHTVEPADLACGPRRMRFLFVCSQSWGDALVRVKSEIGQALHAGQARFARVASDVKNQDVKPPSQNLALRAETPVELGGGVSLYTLAEARPLVWTPTQVEPGGNLCDSTEWLLGAHGRGASGRAAVVEGVAFARSFEVPALLEYRREGPNRIRVDISSPDSDQLVIFNESFNRGWRALLDGRPTPIRRVNAVVQGVWVPKGEHEVHFDYRPTGWMAGGIVSAVGWLILCGWVMLQTLKRQQA